MGKEDKSGVLGVYTTNADPLKASNFYAKHNTKGKPSRGNEEGTKLTILCLMLGSLEGNIGSFGCGKLFGAINNGELMVEIEDIALNKDTIMHFLIGLT